MLTNRYLQEFVDKYFGGDPGKVERLQIVSERFPLSEEEGLTFITPYGHPFWQVVDLSPNNFPALRDIAIADQPVFGYVDLENVDNCLIFNCPHLKIRIHGKIYDVSSKDKAWIYNWNGVNEEITIE